MPPSTPSPLLPLAALVFTACRLVTLPPASSRTDGGPVAARGTISHEARSQVRLYRDAAGCESVQTVSRQFRVVTVTDRTGGPRRLVLEESYDVRHCLTSESVSSEAVVTAWNPDDPASEPLYRITGRGVTGAPVGTLYRMVSRSCCGSRALSTYYSLLSGRVLFSASGPALRLDDPSTGEHRFLAFHDTYSAHAPPEAARDSALIGVLQVGTDREAAARVAITSTRPGPFAAAEFAFTRRGRPLADSVLTVGPAGARDQLGVRIRLTTPAPGHEVVLDLPLHGLGVAVERARLPKGISLRPVP
jgi:hypothetical protein